MQCVVGKWKSTLDQEDKEAFKQAIGRMTRADLHGVICAAHQGRPFGLTALKDCLNGRCVCD